MSAIVNKASILDHVMGSLVSKMPSIALSQYAQHYRTRRDIAHARYKMGGARHAYLILLGAPSCLRYLY